MADILGGYLVAKALKRQGVECIFRLIHSPGGIDPWADAESYIGTR